MENGKEPERGCLLNQKGQGRAGQGSAGKVGRVGSSVVLCCALSGVLELSACRGYRLCGVVYGYN